MRIPVRGVIYKDVHEASRALGVTTNTIYAAAARGTLDTVGLGRGRHGRHVEGPRAVPVPIGPYEYTSIRHACRELNLSRKELSRWLRNRGVQTNDRAPKGDDV